MAHKPADTTVSVGERMDIVEAVMGGGDSNDAPPLLERLEPILPFEILHEIRNAVAGRRKVPADVNFMLRQRAPLSRLHDNLAVLAAHAEHLIGRVLVKFPMEPADEVARGRFWQTVLCRQFVDLGLDSNMGSRLNLEVAALLVLIELAGERASGV